MTVATPAGPLVDPRVAAMAGRSGRCCRVSAGPLAVSLYDNSSSRRRTKMLHTAKLLRSMIIPDSNNGITADVGNRSLFPRQYRLRIHLYIHVNIRLSFEAATFPSGPLWDLTPVARGSVVIPLPTSVCYSAPRAHGWVGYFADTCRMYIGTTVLHQ